MRNKIFSHTISVVSCMFSIVIFGQSVSGIVYDIDRPIENARIRVLNSEQEVLTDKNGFYKLSGEQSNVLTVTVSAEGFLSQKTILKTNSEQNVAYNFYLFTDNSLDEIVLSANLKPSLKSNSATAIEVYPASFFEKNLNTNLFQALEMINGVQPQLNCNVCNTGDIQINGMPGAYTMILIDGMPIVSALSTVYGLQGIPLSMIDQIEVIKGPASSLYGSEAMGGIVNIITKDPENTAKLFAAVSSSTWLENNIDVAGSYNISNVIHGLSGLNYYKYGQVHDKNGDGFTDVTLQDRISLFNKFTTSSKFDKKSSLALRYVYEDRWGGENNWTSKDRGSESIYAESIYTNRVEAMAFSQLPTQENIFVQFSYVYHQQNSMYGTESYQGKQQNAFGQLVWSHNYQRHEITLGGALKYGYYNDDTIATGHIVNGDLINDDPEKKFVPGIFIQDQWNINDKNLILIGYRFDYDPIHKGIHSPRVAYKYSLTKQQAFRASFGTGFRSVNVFSEDHRSLTGNRDVVFLNKLRPEKSANTNVTYTGKFPHSFGVVDIEVNGFYSHFFNRIIPDIDTDSSLIIYDNLDGYAISKGVSLQAKLDFDFPLSITLSSTYMRVYSKEDKEKIEGYFAPKLSFNGQFGYEFVNGIKVDLTANYKGPMKMELVEDDYRPEYSVGTLLLDLQVSKQLSRSINAYIGVKNLLNTLPKNDVISRWWDPHGNPGNGVIPPNGREDVMFEPNGYSYTSMLGVRAFMGISFTLF